MGAGLKESVEELVERVDFLEARIDELSALVRSASGSQSVTDPLTLAPLRLVRLRNAGRGPLMAHVPQRTGGGVLSSQILRVEPGAEAEFDAANPSIRIAAAAGSLVPVDDEARAWLAGLAG